MGEAKKRRDAARSFVAAHEAAMLMLEAEPSILVDCDVRRAVHLRIADKMLAARQEATP